MNLKIISPDNRLIKLEKYIINLFISNHIKECLMNLSLSIIHELIQLVSNEGKVLSIPNCSSNDIGTVLMYVWKKDNHYLECEMFEEGENKVEFFYLNKLNEDIWMLNMEEGLFSTNFNSYMRKELVDILKLFSE